MTTRRTPLQDGLKMPAEWAPHAGCYISWPCKEQTWQGHFKEAKESYLEVIKAINMFEPVTVLADPSVSLEARQRVGKEIEVLEVRLDDSWARDNGPIFVTSDDGGVSLVNFKFNGWGKFTPYENDDALPIFIAEKLGMKRYDAPMVLEGGSISVDGEGTLITTEQCLLNPNRNPLLTREGIENNLADYLGVKKVIWLWRGLLGDLTDGHVDAVAAFVGPRLLLAAHTDDRTDPNFEALDENMNRLMSSTDAKGRSLEIIKVKQAKPFDFRGFLMTPYYCNNYVANGGVIAPIFGIPEDKMALEVLRSAYPDREVIGIDARYLELGGGAAHCITQQRPKGYAIPP
ncbi:MAG: agmatine deiminase family protein [Thermoplasmata archaeon]